MAIKNVSTDMVVESANAPAVGSFDLSLDEFCIRLSSGKVGPEMIGGFRHDSIAAGRLKDSEVAFAAAFNAFTRRPA